MARSAPGQRALRRGRASQAGQPYLVTTVTWGRQLLFRSLPAGRCVVRALRNAEKLGLAKTLAFVVMPDHLHWLLTLQARSLSLVVGGTKATAAAGLHREGLVQGPVWQRGFHDHALRREEALADVARYVVLNPVRAGLVRRITDYPLWDAVWL